jgi:hypothetical protein
MQKNGSAGSNGVATPAVNGKAYPLTDHTYDVVIVGAGGAGLRRGGPAHGLHHQGVSHPLAHGGSPGRRRRGAR